MLVVYVQYYFDLLAFRFSLVGLQTLRMLINVNILNMNDDDAADSNVNIMSNEIDPNFMLIENQDCHFRMKLDDECSLMYEIQILFGQLKIQVRNNKNMVKMILKLVEYILVFYQQKDMEQTFKLLSFDEFTCQGNVKAQHLCCDKGCSSNALLCPDTKCVCQNQKHIKCTNKIKISELISNLEKEKMTIPNQTKDMITLAQSICDEVIDRFSLIRNKLNIGLELFGLLQNSQQVVRMLNDGSQRKITGSLIYDANSEIESSNKSAPIYFPKQQLQRIWVQNRHQIDKVLQCFQKYIQPTKPQIIKQISSKIMSQQQKIVLLSFIPKKVNQLKLLFRASEHEFSAFKFHELCDNITPTIVVMKTTFDKVVGGYTPLKWKSTVNWQSQNDKDGDTFLFSLSLKQKFPIIDRRKAIQYAKDWGPTFSYAPDLAIVHKCNKINSAGMFPTCFNNGNYVRNQEATQKFFGVVNGSNYYVAQYQVYQVL